MATTSPTSPTQPGRPLDIIDQSKDIDQTKDQDKVNQLHRKDSSTDTFNESSSPLQRSTTTQSGMSKLSKVLSNLPNPERDMAKKGGGPPGGPPGGGPPGGHGGPPGPPGGGPPLRKYAYGFFAPEMTFFRKLAIKILVMSTVLTILIMWICAPFYWGSLWKANKYTHNLTVRVVDLDGGPIGSAISQALLSRRELGYFHTPATHFADMAAIEHDVVQEGSWAAITINAGASAGLEAARAAGDATYDGRKAVSFIYAQARNEIATGNYLIPLGTAALTQITSQLSVKSVGELMASGNATLIASAGRAPTTLVAPISFAPVNLRPYDQPVATAITLVGLIYALIFAFMSTMANAGVREIIAPYLSTKAYLLYRVIAPLLVYLPLSFFFAMVNLPFKPRFDAHFTYAGGFFLWWFVLYLTMASVGFATEFAVTILGPKYTGMFLVPLIVANVSGVSVPHELQPWIYRYNVGMPFYNASRAVRTLIFNTKSTLGLNIGVLLAWIGLSLITVPLITYLFRRGAVNEHRKTVGSNEFDEKLPDGRVV